MASVEFRFYEELNDFLPPRLRKRAFAQPIAQAASVKHAIEALGVPHTEVELILVNGDSVGFSYLLSEGDRVSVYPKFEALDITPLLKVRERPLRTPRFIADAHLGGLARYLRLLGFDTLYLNAYDDKELARIAVTEQRIVLTRDRELLKRRAISHGCYIRAVHPQEQLREIVSRLDLRRAAAPVSRCLCCNTRLQPVVKQDIIALLASDTAHHYERFWTCRDCNRIYWQGSHWRRMRRLIDETLAE